MFAEEGAFPILQSLGQLAIKVYEDGIKGQRQDIEHEDFDTVAAVAGYLGRGNLLQCSREVLKREGGRRELHCRVGES
jgi:hypothetical protein